MTRPRTLNSNAAIEAWDDVYADVAQFERNEAERNRPQPIITPCLLMAFALAMFAVNLAVFGKGAW